MKKCLIVGRPNAGKTLFMINFAEYVGLKHVEIKFFKRDKEIDHKKYTIEEARELLSSDIPYKTNCLQSTEIKIPVLKGKKIVSLMDSSGLIDGIHKNIQIRRAMAQTLGAITESHMILHMIDASKINDESIKNTIGEVDYQLVEYGRMKEGYMILANKVDLLERKTPIIQLQKEFPDHYIIPISALTKEGFGEVRSFVCRRL
ncbi:GTPase [Crassaminicella profunda]|uniref:GTPase n=1 Tax=Crassaminicella profunda TaxID=1286698 RepID=UPI001CA6C823|nr:GTPase [Crassaminicella profunda]QZY56909.1 50S ribosome-binding GTPase [Crassaminicella profunda]